VGPVCLGGWVWCGSVGGWVRGCVTRPDLIWKIPNTLSRFLPFPSCLHHQPTHRAQGHTAPLVMWRGIAWRGATIAGAWVTGLGALIVSQGCGVTTDRSARACVFCLSVRVCVPVGVCMQLFRVVDSRRPCWGAPNTD
jgi:hypothetical protein